MLPHFHVTLTCENNMACSTQCDLTRAGAITGHGEENYGTSSRQALGRGLQPGCCYETWIQSSYIRIYNIAIAMSNPILRIVDTLQWGDGAGNKVCTVATSAQL